MALQIRRGTDTERSSVVFAEGELVYITDTDALFIGDGSTAGGIKLTDNAGAILGTYITADTNNSKINLQQNLDLNGNDIIGTGNININGTITATGNVNIGDDANTDTVDFTAKITSSLTPNADSTYNIGAANARWNNGYFTGLTVDGQIDAVSLNGNVIADNSTVMVDVSANTFTGDLTGDVTGNLNGNLTGNVTGNVTGDVTGNTTGYHTGDVKGSVFGDDSTPIIDAVGNNIFTNSVTFSGGMSINDANNDFTIDASNGSTNIINFKVDGGDVYIDANGVLQAGQGVVGNVTGNTAGTHTGDVTGNVVGNTTGYHTGDVKGTVFGNDSTILVDAVNNTISGSVISGTITANLTGNAAGDHSGTFTGNIFTSLIDSADSSAIVVTPAMTFNADIIMNQGFEVNPDGALGGQVIRGRPDGELSVRTLRTLDVIHDSGGEIKFKDRTGFENRSTFENLLIAQDKVELFRISGATNPSLVLHTFTGDPDDDVAVANPANYDTHFEATNEKVTFGVPAKFAVVADDTARTALVPSPEKGMVILMEAGTTPAATNQLQFFDGSNWTNV